MDFSDIPSKLQEIPDSAEDYWRVIADMAFERARKVGAGSNHYEVDLAAQSALVEFLNEIATSLDLDLRLHFDQSKSYDENWILIEASISSFKNSITVKALVEKFSPGIKTKSSSHIPLSNSSVVTLFGLSRELRQIVEQIVEEEKRRNRLLNSLNDFDRELTRKQMSSAVAFGTLAIIGAGIAGTTGTLASLPEAYATLGKITAALGIEKEAAEEVLLIESSIDVPALEDNSGKNNPEETKK